jgi:flagellar assembly factor FliW
MPDLESAEFGRVEFTAADMYDFALGLPGFEDRTRFLLLERTELVPILVLLSLDTPELRFYALDASRLVADYDLQLSPAQCELLGLKAGEAPDRCLLLITWPEDEPPTVNLLAPVVLHAPTHRGLQAIQFDSGHPCRHPLSPPSKAVCS